MKILTKLGTQNMDTTWRETRLETSTFRKWNDFNHKGHAKVNASDWIMWYTIPLVLHQSDWSNPLSSL